MFWNQKNHFEMFWNVPLRIFIRFERGGWPINRTNTSCSLSERQWPVCNVNTSVIVCKWFDSATSRCLRSDIMLMSRCIMAAAAEMSVFLCLFNQCSLKKTCSILVYCMVTAVLGRIKLARKCSIMLYSRPIMSHSYFVSLVSYPSVDCLVWITAAF